MGVGGILIGFGSWQGMSALESAENARNAKIKKQYNGFKDDAEGQALMADIGIGLGAIAVGIGTYLWYQDYKKGNQKKAYNRVSVDIQPDRTNIGYSWSF